MPTFTGYWLDDYTFLCPATSEKDNDGTIYWCKLTMALPRGKDDTIQFDPVTGKAFDMEIIDPEDFEWKGRRLRLCITQEDQV